MTVSIKIAGPCDTTGCPYPATVHYGLEEFYCAECDVKNAAEQKRWEESERGREQKAKWERVIFDGTWPKACRSCDASGVVVFYESHGMPGPGEQIVDPCEKCEDHCPRCGWRFGEGSSHEDFFDDGMPCPECRWNWGKDQGDLRPGYDGP